jgi:hypothetical protein
MMRFIVRELAGWVLLVLGLLAFVVCYDLLRDQDYPVILIERGTPYPQLLNAVPMVVIAVILFRGGLHLLKVAVAARLCLEAREAGGAAPKRRSATAPAPRIPGR